MTILTALLLAVFGLAMTVGGAWLLALGGSAYYLVAGLVLLLTAAFVPRRIARARMLYALLLFGTGAWAFNESGADWWPLATRLGLLLLIGLWLLLPAIGRVRDRDKPWAAQLRTAAGEPARRAGGGRAALVAAVLLVGIAALMTLREDPHEVVGQLAAAVVDENPALGEDDGADPNDWRQYGRTLYGQRYSPIDQIRPDNAAQLEQAWSFRTGDMRQPEDIGETTYQATPLKIGPTLYLCTPHHWLIALDADTGARRWVYDPKVGFDPQRQHQTCRGVSYWDGRTAAATTSGTCDERLFLPTSKATLVALDPHSGQPCADFATQGVLDLTHNMPFKQSGYYYSTSPPVITGDRVIVAGAVNDNYAIDEPSGVVRAYDVRTGRLLWNWDSGRPDDTTPLDVDDPTQKYTTSSPNSWAPASADPQLGLVYLPMGNRTPDQLGMYRTPAEEKYAASVVALDIATGAVRWVRQFVHHDLWDMDTPAQPSLLDLDTPAGRTPALVVPTKQGDIYVLDRRSGEPIVPVIETKAPGGAIDKDHASPTQPASALSFNPETLTERHMWGGTPLDQLWCRIRFRSLRYEGRYTPPSIEGTIVYPGNFGVFNWGGIAVDPKRQQLFGMPLHLAFVSQLVPKASLDPNAKTNVGEHGVNANEGGPFAVAMNPFLSPLGVPCQQPPWGYVAGVDLRTGKVAWQRRNGTIRDLSPVPLPIRMGVPGIGGPLVTGAGVVFLGAAVDNDFRAYELATGKELWDVRLPAGGQATPMTYLDSQGRQTVVLVAGGHGSIGTTAGDYVIAWRLPRASTRP